MISRLIQIWHGKPPVLQSSLLLLGADIRCSTILNTKSWVTLSNINMVIFSYAFYVLRTNAASSALLQESDYQYQLNSKITQGIVLRSLSTIDPAFNIQYDPINLKARHQCPII